jgi:hypothetical protein
MNDLGCSSASRKAPIDGVIKKPARFPDGYPRTFPDWQEREGEKLAYPRADGNAEAQVLQEPVTGRGRGVGN